MGTIKDRNGEDLIKAEEIKKRWKEYREQNKKDLNDPDNHNGVSVTQTQEKTYKPSGGDQIPAEL